MKRVVTCGVVLYRNQWPVNFILHFTELVVLSDTKNTLVGNYLIKCNKIKIALISFNCFSEYIIAVLSFLWPFLLLKDAQNVKCMCYMYIVHIPCTICKRTQSYDHSHV